MTAYLIYYFGYMKYFGVASYPDVTAANEAAEKTPNAWTAKVIETESSVANALAGKLMIDVFNALSPVGETQIKKFESREVGARRTFQRIVDCEKKDPPVADPTEIKSTTVTEVEENKENDVAKSKKPKRARKAKATKPGKKRAAKTNGKRKPRDKDGPMTETEVKTLELCTRARGATLEEIMEKLDLTDGTARNAVGRARRKSKKKITMTALSENRRAYIVG